MMLDSGLLHPLADFMDSLNRADDASPTYWYEGICPQTGVQLRLPRTPSVEAIARCLMQQFTQDDAYSIEGKMYGVLLVESTSGELAVLKAFSGLWQGQSMVKGWVPPIPGRDRVALAEASTLASLDALKQELLSLQNLPERQRYQKLAAKFAAEQQALTLAHQQRKQARQIQRQNLLASLQGEALAEALEPLDQQSRWDGIERRRLKQKRDVVLHPLKQTIDQADRRIHEIKQQRKHLSRQLQAQMHTAYYLTNFLGQSLPLHHLIPGGAIPTGTGDCCAPKLLHYAATHNLKPLAMAEFWWGKPSIAGDRIPGEFYGACHDRCQPLMGFLLAGLPQLPTSINASNLSLPLSILYEDEWLIAINKPSGLLSVPGRYFDRQDSVLSRLRHQLLDGSSLKPVHRLDQDTSGVLLFARTQQTYHHLSQQFQQRQIHKVYEAILVGTVMPQQGTIDLPLWGDPNDRPRQKVNWQHGKPSITHFQVLSQTAENTRLEFLPVTGRTHQIRVHAADPQGLGVPILGDRLYGDATSATRLHLHARAIKFEHPHLKQAQHLTTETPF
jgi:tRNA pseudouridine32 synthase / 23S rRNA pseudouridine746 synthase